MTALLGHLAILRSAYSSKRDALIEALSRHCRSTLTVEKPCSGMFVWARTRRGIPLLSDDAWLTFGQRHRVLVVPGSTFHIDGPPQPWLRLGFANPDVPALITAAQRLGAGLDALAQSP
jgi:DNA-binding transcriptional MocR family regulator